MKSQSDIVQFQEMLTDNSSLVIETIPGTDDEQAVTLVLPNGTQIVALELGPSGRKRVTFADGQEGLMNYVPIYDLDDTDVPASDLQSWQYNALELSNDYVRGYH